MSRVGFDSLLPPPKSKGEIMKVYNRSEKEIQERRQSPFTPYRKGEKRPVYTYCRRSKTKPNLVYFKSKWAWERADVFDGHFWYYDLPKFPNLKYYQKQYPDWDVFIVNLNGSKCPDFLMKGKIDTVQKS